jgi:hypothetical protein
MKLPFISLDNLVECTAQWLENYSHCRNVFALSSAGEHGEWHLG